MLILAALALAAPPPSPPYRPRVARQAGDLQPCPGITPDIRRPRRSNCFGIMPQACGADVAARFVGRPGDRATRATLARAVKHQRIRWILPREPVTQDLRGDRLNVHLSATGRIARVDCY